jgi:LssY-like putative type I secretion system component LssY
MNAEPARQTEGSAPKHRRRGLHLAIRLLVGGLVVYLAVAFLILPLIWRRHEERHPALADAETVTHTKSGIPGDPLNVALVGSEEPLHRGMLAAGWFPADPITIESSLRIAVGVVFKRPFDEAPVSPLYLFGRKQDFAFEKPVGDNPRERHHVRFWRSDKIDDQGRPLWWGAATFDTHVGFSHLTGQITHHISPNVDADRDLLIEDLRKAGALSSISWIEQFQKQKEGKNGEGDPWHSDGRLAIGYITVLMEKHSPSPTP